MEIWAIARYDLGIEEAEVGRLTLGLFDGLLDRHLEAHRRSMLYAGVVAAELWNASPYRGEKAKYISPLAFVPELASRKKHDHSSQSLDDQIKILTAVMRCGPGKVN
jgi:hypothetical protein